jgi:hypothetical protein
MYHPLTYATAIADYNGITLIGPAFNDSYLAGFFGGPFAADGLTAWARPIPPFLNP